MADENTAGNGIPGNGAEMPNTGAEMPGAGTGMTDPGTWTTGAGTGTTGAGTWTTGAGTGMTGAGTGMTDPGAGAAGACAGTPAENAALYASLFDGIHDPATGLTGLPGNAANIRSAYGPVVPGHPYGSPLGDSGGHSLELPGIVVPSGPAWGDASSRGPYVGIDELRRRLAAKRTRVLLRYAYYEMKNQVRDLGISTPPALRMLNSALGWCASAVDSLADRMVFREFRNDVFDFNTIFADNCGEILTSSACLSALISSCSFIRIFHGEDGEICLESLDGGDATGVIDPRTMLLKEGYCVLSRSIEKTPVLEAWMLPFKTVYYKYGKPIRTEEHSAPWPLLAPIVHRPDAMRPFGHSRISRACMSATASAVRTIKRSEISAEFYSFPQKYVVGLSRDTELPETWQMSMSSFLSLTEGEEGQKPTFGQFNQQSQEPHLAQLRMFASIFAGETGMTLDDMGFPSDNPSSEEAIKAAHETLRRKGHRAQATFGVGLKNAGYLAACLRDAYPYKRKALSLVKPIWEPLFEPDASGLSLIGDGVLKLNQAVENYVSPQMLEDMTGLRREGST